jgi:hypothetical protein
MFLTFLKQNSIYWKVTLCYFITYLIASNLNFSNAGTIAYSYLIDIFIARASLILLFIYSFYLFITVGLIDYAIFAFYNYKK